MKHVLLVLLICFGLTTAAQEEKPAEKLPEVEFGCVIWPIELKPIPHVFNADKFYRKQIKQPYGLIACLPCGNISKEAKEAYWQRMNSWIGPLNQDLPYVNTLAGAVFTFDYIRPTVR